MRTLPFAATLAALLTALLARQAAADEPAAIAETAPAAASEPSGETAPQSARDDARMLELQEQLFAHEALSIAGHRVMRGGTALSPGMFYTLVGRPDLADQIRLRRIGKGFVIGVGAAAMATGTIWGIGDAAATAWDNSWSIFCGSSAETSCPHRQTSMAPWAVVFGGGVVMVTGLVMRTDPLGPKQKYALAYDYNQHLRAHMRLSSALEAAKRTANVSAAVLPSGQSGILLASCAF